MIIILITNGFISKVVNPKASLSTTLLCAGIIVLFGMSVQSPLEINHLVYSKSLTQRDRSRIPS
jgi:hypothetical protein